ETRWLHSSSARMFGSNHHGVASGPARTVVEHDRAIDLHRKAITLPQPVALLAPSNLHCAFEYPDLLVDTHVAATGFESHALARWKMHLDDLHRLGHARR